MGTAACSISGSGVVSCAAVVGRTRRSWLWFGNRDAQKDPLGVSPRRCEDFDEAPRQRAIAFVVFCSGMVWEQGLALPRLASRRCAEVLDLVEVLPRRGAVEGVI